jgi:hypothetical protein
MTFEKNNYFQNNVVTKQEEHSEGNAEFYLWSITFILIDRFTFVVNLRHGPEGFTSRPKEVVLRIINALKAPSPLAGFESANLGSNGKHAVTGSSPAI